MIDVRGVAKRFNSAQKEGGTEALRDLSFAVKDKEFVSLLGPSGCGKSTALRLVAGLLSPDDGDIAWPHGKPEIGFVFQEPTLMPWADALTNARLPLDLKHMPRAQADARAAETLARETCLGRGQDFLPLLFVLDGVQTAQGKGTSNLE